MNVGTTPTEVGVLYKFIRNTASGDPIIAPPPNPMIASPVASPGRSGNHLMRVDTGEMYPIPSPTPPSTPYPRYRSHSRCVPTATADTRNPPPKHAAAASIAF